MKTVREFALAALSVSLVAFLAALAGQAHLHPVTDPDTVALTKSMTALTSCLSSGTLCNEVSHQPLFVQFPAFVMHQAGFAPAAVASGLQWTSFVLSLLLLGWLIFRSVLSLRDPPDSRLAPPELLILVFLTGQMIPWYGSAQSENVSAALAGTLCFAMVGRRNIAAFIATAALTVSRDFAVFPVLLLMLGCWFAGGARRLRDLTVPAAGVVCGLTAALWFNFLRYGAPVNTSHLSPVFMAGSLQQVQSQALAALLSPNGGLMFFWAGNLLLILAGVSHTKGEIKATGEKALLCCVAALVLVAISAAFYENPFSWIAWGNRTLLPWTAGAAVVAGTVFARAGNVSWQTRAHALMFIAVFTAFNIPHLLAAADNAVPASVFAPTEMCPGPGDVLADKAHYFSCLNRYLWPTRTVLTEAFQIVRLSLTGWLLVITGSLVAASALWLLMLRGLPAGKPD